MQVHLDRAVACRNDLWRLVERFRDLPQGAGPMGTCCRRQFVGRLDHPDGVDECGLQKGVGTHWAGPSLSGDGLGWTQVDVLVFWETVNSILRGYTSMIVPNLVITSIQITYRDV